jgi:tellurite resistance protein TerC
LLTEEDGSIGRNNTLFKHPGHRKEKNNSMDITNILIIIQLIFLEGILSIDNVSVLGALVVPLPDDQPIIWPKVLKKLGDVLHPVLGNQRTAALRVGLLGAYLGQSMMLLLATLIMHNYWLKFLGAAYLIRLAFDNLGMAEEGEADAHIHKIDPNKFWLVVVTVELTDLVFSLDNVVAAVALSNQFWVLFLGVAIAIVLIRFAAGWYSYLVEREPILLKAAYVLILNIGIEIILEETVGWHISDLLRFTISLATILLCLLYAHSRVVQLLRPVFVWLAQGFSNVNELIDWLFVPFTGLLKLIIKGINHLFNHQQLATNENKTSQDPPSQ